MRQIRKNSDSKQHSVKGGKYEQQVGNHGHPDGSKHTMTAVPMNKYSHILANIGKLKKSRTGPILRRFLTNNI